MDIMFLKKKSHRSVSRLSDSLNLSNRQDLDDNIQLSRTKELFRSEYMHQNSPVQLYSLFSLIILSFFNIFLRVLSHYITYKLSISNKNPFDSGESATIYLQNCIRLKLLINATVVAKRDLTTE